MESIGRKLPVVKDTNSTRGPAPEIPDRVPVRNRTTGEIRHLWRIDAAEVLRRFSDAYDTDAETRLLLKLDEGGDYDNGV